MRRAVSFYSYQQTYYLRELTLEQCVQTAVATGAKGIEVIAEQMMPGFPDLDDTFYASWHEWMERYGAIPLVHDMFLDVQLHRGRPLDLNGQFEMLRRDIRHASRLGCQYLRMVVTTPPEVVARAIPYAAEQSVVLLLEVHTPWHVEHEWIQRHLEVYSRFGPEVCGIIPDFGIFVARFPRLQGEYALRSGVRPEIVRHVMDVYDAASGTASGPTDLSFLVTDVLQLGGEPIDVAFAKEASRHVWSNPSTLLDVMPYVHHVHAKFWEMTDDGDEYSIPYTELIETLRAGQYDGYLASEYEGQLWLRDIDEVDEIGAVRRHQDMLARLLNEPG
jgi:sugar phosphate isomerase/epimerase